MPVLAKLSNPVLFLLALAVTATPGLTQERVVEDPEVVAEEGLPAPGPTVTVMNHNWLDMHVYVTRAAGGRVSLGVVTSHQKARFELPRTMIDAGGDIRIIADPIGSPGHYVSPIVIAHPGTDVAVHLEAALSMSSVSLRTTVAKR